GGGGRGPGGGEGGEQSANPARRDGGAKARGQVGIDIEKPAPVGHEQMKVVVALEEMDVGRARGSGGHEKLSGCSRALPDSRFGLGARIHFLRRRGGALSLPPIWNCRSLCQFLNRSS